MQPCKLYPVCVYQSGDSIPGEKQAEELGASLAAELMFYAVASAVLANEV